MRRLIQLVIPCVLLSGCFGPGEGVEVPKDEIYFPVGLALSRDGGADHPPNFLFVVSSDFDLQYNGGAVQSYDLSLLEKELPQRCVVDADCAGAKLGGICQAGGMCAASEAAEDSPCPQGDRHDADRLLFPGRCNPINPLDVRVRRENGEWEPRASVKIGAFATDALLRERPADKPSLTDAPERLFVPVRGDSTLHWIDVDSTGKLECGQEGAPDHACNDGHRSGDKPEENPRGIKLNAEPFGLDADARGDQIVVTNQTTGTAALFLNDAWNDEGPKLTFELASDSIPSRPIGIAAVPQPLAPGEAASSYDTFMMTFRNSAQVRMFRFAPDGTLDTQNDPRPYLVDGGGVGITANSVGSDSRGIAIDDSARKAAKDRCASGDQACASAAGLIPLDVYVANRTPSSLLIGRTQPPQEYPYFFQTVPLTTGPSRVVVGQVYAQNGQDKETRVFVACFESRRIFVYDPQRSRVETEILTGRGPHALAVDTERKLLYVGHFTDSYVGVYSLDLASPATYGTMLGTLGKPKQPRASK